MNNKNNLISILVVLISIIAFVGVSFLQAEEYEEWLKTQNKEFKNYKTNMDKSFIKMLKQENKNWEKYKTKHNYFPIKNKPMKLPIAPKEVVQKEQELKNENKNEQQKKELAIDDNSLNVVASIISPVIVSKPKQNEKEMAINFFYNDIKIIYDKKFKISNQKANKKGISKFFELMSEQNFDILKNSISINKKQLKLNDWGLYLLIDKIADGFQLNKNNKALFSWYVLLKLNYDVKISYTKNNELFLLASFKQKLYQVSFYELNKKSYYILNNKGYFTNSPSIITYKKQYKNNLYPLDMSIKEVIKTNKKYEVAKKLSFEHNNRQYNIKSYYNKGLVDYYDTFAQSDYSIYLNSKMPNTTFNQFSKSLRPLLKNNKDNKQNELYNVNFLLSLVQKSFKYKTDYAQFGKEKIFFSSATLYYPYSDCEDRSIIFSRLVKDLLGLEVVAIKYKNHLSTAIKLKNLSNIKKGDKFVIYKKQKYIIADPTYVNARAGMIMPIHKNAKYEIIK
jgi:hypothetical protein